jgi:hypothetical protein
MKIDVSKYMQARRAAAERKINTVNAHGFAGQRAPGYVIHGFDRFSKGDRLVALQ